ncbi:MAG: FadR/GntR family transcriptional regulator, partial [Agrobacterium albertimagni]
MSEPGSLLRSLSGRSTARNYHSHVINEIGAGVISGRYPIGTTLPNDAELMEEFEVSRTVLREALKTLEAKGLLEARPKVGTKVAKKSRWSLYDPQVLAWHLEAPVDAEFLSGLHEVRRSLEPQAAAEVARRRTADQIRLMLYWIHQMETSLGSLQN